MTDAEAIEFCDQVEGVAGMVRLMFERMDKLEREEQGLRDFLMQFGPVMHPQRRAIYLLRQYGDTIQTQAEEIARLNERVTSLREGRDFP